MNQYLQSDPFPDLAGPFTRDEQLQRLAVHPDISPIGEPMVIDPGRTFLVNVLDNRTHAVWGIIYAPDKQEGKFIRADWLPARRP
jgi:hypothetical protein